MNHYSVFGGRLAPTLLTSKPAVQNANDEKDDKSEDEKSGSEAGPTEAYVLCGIDVAAMLPGALAGSTVMGAMCMFSLQLPLLARFSSIYQVALIAFLVLYVVTIICNLYCLWADPGQIQEDAPGDVEEGGSGPGTKVLAIPAASEAI
eukprot:Skav231965  [mRNA]  locus=scaffold2806:261807:262250:+ [translate_table: standard]